MTREADRLKSRHCNERDPAERGKIKKDLDQVPLSDGELNQVEQREIDRKKSHIEEFHRSK